MVTHQAELLVYVLSLALPSLTSEIIPPNYVSILVPPIITTLEWEHTEIIQLTLAFSNVQMAISLRIQPAEHASYIAQPEHGEIK